MAGGRPTPSTRSSRCWRAIGRRWSRRGCTYGCPIGSLALELHEPDPAVRKLLAANFHAWSRAVEHCLKEAGPRIPRGTNLGELASFILTTMEGGVMQARTHRSPATYDAAVRQLRIHFSHLEAAASTKQRKAS